MSQDVLLRFLSNGLLDVGGDDAKLEKLRATASDLSGTLKKKPSKASAYALVAFDPHVAVDDVVVRETLDALKSRWATYVNTFSSTPIAVVRAILLDALVLASADDDRIGLAFVTSARNALPFMEIGSEQMIWADVVTSIERKVDSRAEDEWATPSSIDVPAMMVDLPPLSAPKLKTGKTDRARLAELVRAAGGPQWYNPQGSNVATGGNQFWPNNSPSQWLTEFGNRMADAIGEVVDGISSKTSIEQTDLSAPLQKLAMAVSSHVNATLQAVSSATAGLQRRTNLIWWKEALFSPSTSMSYRELPPTIAAAQMAFDLHLQIPTFAPASVSAFLSEAVFSLPSIEPSRAFPIRDLVLEAQADAILATLRSAAAELVEQPDSRGPVLALIAHPSVSAARERTEFRRLTGMPEDAQLTLSNWATWIFRELQAARASNDGAKTPRRARKG